MVNHSRGSLKRSHATQPFSFTPGKLYVTKIEGIGHYSSVSFISIRFEVPGQKWYLQKIGALTEQGQTDFHSRLMRAEAREKEFRGTEYDVKHRPATKGDILKFVAKLYANSASADEGRTFICWLEYVGNLEGLRTTEKKRIRSIVLEYTRSNLKKAKAADRRERSMDSDSDVETAKNLVDLADSLFRSKPRRRH